MVQERLGEARDELNRAFASHLASALVITVGDEFQGLLHRPESVVDLLARYEEAMDFFPTRFGLGWGPLSTRLKPEAIGMDGPCFHAAREALVIGKAQDRWVTVRGFGERGTRQKGWTQETEPEKKQLEEEREQQEQQHAEEREQQEQQHAEERGQQEQQQHAEEREQQEQQHAEERERQEQQHTEAQERQEQQEHQSQPEQEKQEGATDDRILNGIFAVLGGIREQWTPTQGKTVALMRRAATQKDVARQRGVATSTIHKALKGAMYGPLIEAETSLRLLLERAGRE